MKGRALSINFCVAIAVLGLSLFLGELCLRLFFRNITSTGNFIGYFSERWKRDHVSLNSRQFREREFASAPSHALYRIAVIGDSYTFGQGMAEAARFTNQLQDLLNAKQDGYEVLNFGRCGATTLSQLELLENVLEQAIPDFVLLQWTVNDVDGDDFRARPQYWPVLPSAALESRLLKHSALFYFVYQQWHSLQTALGFVTPYEDYLRSHWGDPNGAGARHYRDILSRFVRRSREAGIPVGLVLFPQLTPDLEEGYPFAFAHALVHEVCAQENLTCLDLRLALIPYVQEIGHQKLWVNHLDAHPGPLVHRLAAERLLEVYEPAWIASAEHGES